MISINSTLIEVSFIGYVNNKFGAGNRNRTRDLLLTRQLLYLLSYTGKLVARIGIEPILTGL